MAATRSRHFDGRFLTGGDLAREQSNTAAVPLWLHHQDRQLISPIEIL